MILPKNRTGGDPVSLLAKAQWGLTLLVFFFSCRLDFREVQYACVGYNEADPSYVFGVCQEGYYCTSDNRCLLKEAVSFITRALISGQVGTPYAQPLLAKGGIEPYVFSGSDLPTFLSLSPDGILSGTSDLPGRFPLTITVTDSWGAMTTVSFILEIY